MIPLGDVSRRPVRIPVVTGGIITLNAIVSGFEETSHTQGYGREEPKSGIALTNRPPRKTAYESAMKLELPEDMVLPYEWPQESDWYWRVFRVPAALLNRILGLGEPVITQAH